MKKLMMSLLAIALIASRTPSTTLAMLGEDAYAQEVINFEVGNIYKMENIYPEETKVKINHIYKQDNHIVYDEYLVYDEDNYLVENGSTSYRKMIIIPPKGKAYIKINALNNNEEPYTYIYGYSGGRPQVEKVNEFPSNIMYEKDILLDKIWTVKFNKEVDHNSINKDAIYILDENQNKILLDYDIEKDKVKLTFKEGYKPNTRYTINITNKVKSDNKNLKQNIIKVFETINEAELKETDGKYFMFNKDTGTIIRYSKDGPKNVVIPKAIEGVSVANIGGIAFVYRYLKSVDIPDTVTNIGNQAFEYNNLSKVTVPSSIIKIGNDVFDREVIIIKK